MMQTDSIEYITTTPTLHSYVVVNKIVETIAERVKQMPNYTALRFSLDLILYICNLVENLVFENGIKKKDQPANYKRDIATRVFQALDWTKSEDTQFLLNSIQFLWSSGRIKKISFWKRVWSKIRRFLVK